MAQLPRLVSLLLMATLLVVLGVTFYHVLAPFLMPLFLAAVFAILSQPIFKRILLRTNGRTALAAGLTTAVVFTICLVPLAVGIGSAAWQLERNSKKEDKEKESNQNSSEVESEKAEEWNWNRVRAAIRTSPTVQAWVRRYGELTNDPVGIDEIEQEVDSRLREASLAVARKTLGSAGPTLSLLGGVVSAIVSTLTFVIAFFYFLADGPALVDGTVTLIPVHRGYQLRLISQFDQAVRAVVSATFAAALGQGIATGIGMQVAGFGHFFIVTILATLTALVPLLGTWLIWGPYAIFLWYDGQWVAAAALALYGIVVVGLLDNLIRTYVLQSNVKLHPLLAFVSVLGGLEVMGLWGVFIGPIVASCLHALIRIFNAELVAFSQQRQVVTGIDPNNAATMIMSASELMRGPPSRADAQAVLSDAPPRVASNSAATATSSEKPPIPATAARPADKSTSARKS